MFKSIVFVAAAISMSLSYTYTLSQELSAESMPVLCGSTSEIVDTAKNKFNEDIVSTWIDSRIGRYILLSSIDGSSVSLLLLPDGIQDSTCVVSIGSGLIKAIPKSNL